ncbi:hypothetical protein [Burkholderia sp. PAMC 26561]|uniref:hypothetical protein n=1 Tax=Burkholderia sp. PAMC 26561 TaxID=1795043 RepID=UPI0007855FAE|nr:hypothetical protein [Burkholderia sp. PAMC 26561]
MSKAKLKLIAIQLNDDVSVGIVLKPTNIVAQLMRRMSGIDSPLIRGLDRLFNPHRFRTYGFGKPIRPWRCWQIKKLLEHAVADRLLQPTTMVT